MVRSVLTYPNKKLKQKSKKIEVFDSNLHNLLDDMYETMLAHNGIGLAAIQIGVASNVVVIELRDEDENIILPRVEVINPVILSRDGEIKYKEGCLSVPDFYEEVTRSADVVVEYCDRGGNINQIEADGLLAVALQHEMDHLDGRLFFERLSILKRKKFEKEYIPSVKQKGDKVKISDA